MTAERLKQLDIVKLCLGGDNFGIFNGRSRTWSMGAIFAAPDDIPLDVKWQRQYHWPLMLIPGPKHPKTMDPVCKMIVKELVRYCPTNNNTGDNIWVRPNCTDSAYASRLDGSGSEFIFT